MSGPGCGRTVLVVDDDADVRDAIAEVLEDGNYRPLRAENGEVALSALRDASTMPCVILLDVMMPVMDGAEFCARQRSDESLRGIPVVVLSAHADANRSAQRMHAQAFLKKPVDLVELLRTVERFCAKD